MKSLSITTAWNETMFFVKREAGLLIPIVLGLIALPAAFFQAIAPRAVPGQQLEPGAWMWLILPLIVISMVGQLTVTALALGREMVVHDAMALALRRLLPLLGAVLVFAVALVLCAVPLSILSALVVGSETAGTLLVSLAIVIVAIAMWVRLMLMAPVAVAENIGPVAILKRSWGLSKGHFWKLLGFLLAAVLVVAVLSLAASAVGGILIYTLAGRPEPGSLAFFLALLLGAALNTVFAIYFLPLLARIYAQLAGSSNGA